MDHPKIRLVLCDVDCTLLDKGQTVVSSAVFHTIRQAVSCGVQFVIASGRSYPDLKSLFAPVVSIVSFICCDGALAVKNGGILYQATLEKDVVNTLFDKIALSGQESLVIYGRDHTYCFGNNDLFKTSTPVTSINEVYGNVYKLAFFKLSDQTKQAVRSFAAMSRQLSEIYADSSWTEFVAFGTDKGSAAAALQKQWDISSLETAAFGDNTNDFGMLRQARLSFASPAAVSDIKRMCKFQTNSVTDEILNILRER